MKKNMFYKHGEIKPGWSTQEANGWHEKQGWLVGCNFIPSTAINQLEMWQGESFDPFVIDKELSWGASLGFNMIRVFLHNLVWQQDPQGYLRRIDYFLHIAAKYHIKTMLVLFDSVWHPFPKPGLQPLPKNNIHNSGWVQCPGFDILNHPERHNELRSYVQGIVTQFKDDKRILMWDLYNEPDNRNLGSYKDDYYSQPKEQLCLQLLQKTLTWVRQIQPSQPVTMAPWNWADTNSLTDLEQFMFLNSDIISFHWYEPKESMQERIESLKQFGRPIICTEYMARGLGSTFETILPLLRSQNVGGCSWGLVQGKSQAHCPWDSWNITYQNEPELWFHDIFRSSGEPYSYQEVEFLKAFNKKAPIEDLKIA
jgi:hypothetical protein